MRRTRRRRCDDALAQLANAESPILTYHARLLSGHALTRAGDRAGAYASYQAAREALETLRSRLNGEELKIAFVKNKGEVYERLVQLCLEGRSRDRRVRGGVHAHRAGEVADAVRPDVPAGARAGARRRLREPARALDSRAARGVELVLPPGRARAASSRRSIQPSGWPRFSARSAHARRTWRARCAS